MPTTSNIVNQILAYEQDELSGEEIQSFFQELIDTGIVWSLQGHYGRTANTLIAAGYCHPAIGPAKDGEQ